MFFVTRIMICRLRFSSFLLTQWSVVQGLWAEALEPDSLSSTFHCVMWSWTTQQSALCLIFLFCRMGTIMKTEPRSNCRKANLIRRCWLKKEAHLRVGISRRWGTLVQSLAQHFSAERAFYREGKRKQNKEINGSGLSSFLRAGQHNPFL